ncbi:cache domain-containing protein [Marinicella sediminis]|uniref:histidine kinase n=1 Tax=Marinicella sediminis TaxID=1792834 RepID=A0ABV7J4U0_9GAMM|nr:cache domain-containing protein [Marinicella sediminis]
MRIRTKNTLFTSFFLVLVVLVITLFSVSNIRKQGDQRIKNFRAEELEKVKSHLKDLVDVAYETIDQNHRNLSDLEYLSGYYREKLDNILNAGESIIDKYQRLHSQGQISLTQAKTLARNEIKDLRFDGGTGYIWINDTAKPYPTMVMHPTVPDLDGQELKDPRFNNAQGINKNLFVAFVEVTEGGRDGYVDYLWPKPTDKGLTEDVPKLSYVRRYEDWDWILGTGIYIDDAEEDIRQLIKDSVKAMRYADGTGYFWINDNSKPFPRMVMHPTVPELDGEVLDDPKFNNAQGVDKNLFVAFNEVTEEQSEGFVDYLWPKPTPNGLTERTEKMSFVRLHEPTGWIIGSGAYIDNIDAAVADKQEEINQQIQDLMINNLLVSSIFIVLAVIASFVFSDRMAKPIRNLTAVANEISHGKNLAQPINEISRNDEIGELAKSIDRLKASVKIMIERMKKS